MGKMRASLPSLIALCLCGALAAACAGDPKTMQEIFAEGLQAHDSGRYEEAYQAWSSIKDVDLGAMRNVAIMLRTGLGVKKDSKAAQALMQRAAEAGLFTAQADLGDMLLKGEAGPPNPKAAAPWLTLAAMAGHPTAQFELGRLFEEGMGVPKDIEAARRLYKAASDAGVKEAARRLAALPPEPAAQPPALRP